MWWEAACGVPALLPRGCCSALVQLLSPRAGLVEADGGRIEWNLTGGNMGITKFPGQIDRDTVATQSSRKQGAGLHSEPAAQRGLFVRPMSIM